VSFYKVVSRGQLRMKKRIRSRSLVKHCIAGVPASVTIIEDFVTASEMFELLGMFRSDKLLHKVIRNDRSIITEDLPTWLSFIVQKVSIYKKDLPEEVELITLDKNSKETTINCDMALVVGSSATLKFKSDEYKNSCVYKFNVKRHSLLILSKRQNVIVPKDKNRSFTLYVLRFVLS